MTENYWNYANLQKLSDIDLIKQMLSPYTSPGHMRMLTKIFGRRQISIIDAEKIEDGCTITVNCTFQTEETPSFSFVENLLEAY